MTPASPKNAREDLRKLTVLFYIIVSLASVVAIIMFLDLNEGNKLLAGHPNDRFIKHSEADKKFSEVTSLLGVDRNQSRVASSRPTYRWTVPWKTSGWWMFEPGLLKAAYKVDLKMQNVVEHESKLRSAGWATFSSNINVEELQARLSKDVEYRNAKIDEIESKMESDYCSKRDYYYCMERLSANLAEITGRPEMVSIRLSKDNIESSIDYDLYPPFTQISTIEIRISYGKAN